ncbi:hypothetical protein ACFV1L_08375 [Kitasatospora sp. NPDC059646]|uniref:hypothetical protein n=1 Tax=Kitasatospora sp. NPDC059646 TaxID=3346893 RepID=UPI0036C9B1EE
MSRLKYAAVGVVAAATVVLGTAGTAHAASWITLRSGISLATCKAEMNGATQPVRCIESPAGSGKYKFQVWA